MAEERKYPKTLVYDVDRGLKSLAPDDRITQEFGFKPRRFISATSMFKFFDSIHKLKGFKEEDVLGTYEEEFYAVDESLGLEIEVLDSISAFQAASKKEIKGDAERVSLPMWGLIGEATEDLAMKLCRTNTDVIILGHTKSEADNDLGIIRYVPALSGRMKDEIGRHFDCVFYTVVETDNSGARSFKWQVLADERRDAKCRIEAVSKFAAKEDAGKMPQDFKKLFELAGSENQALKILILGNSGTGKTYSLRTLKGVTRNNKKKG